MGLTPKRVQRVLDQWDATTASTQESWFNFQMLLFAVATIVCLVGGAWWLALMCAAITLVCFQVVVGASRLAGATPVRRAHEEELTVRFVRRHS